MERRILALGTLVALTLLASACASGAVVKTAVFNLANYFGVATTQAATTTPTATATMAPAITQGPTPKPVAGEVAIAMNPRFGPILVGQNGMTLYMRIRERGKGSRCYDACAKLWPPLLVSGAPIGGGGLDTSKLGTTTRIAGSVQATYNGYPLYYYSGDKAPGDTNGEGFAGTWFVAGSVGQPIRG